MKEESEAANQGSGTPTGTGNTAVTKTVRPMSPVSARVPPLEMGRNRQGRADKGKWEKGTKKGAAKAAAIADPPAASIVAKPPREEKKRGNRQGRADKGASGRDTKKGAAEATAIADPPAASKVLISQEGEASRLSNP